MASAPYVYFLIDPRDGSTFYVGKGTGKRVKSHVRFVKRGKVDNAEKCKRIREIHEAGFVVEERIVETFATDDQAFTRERELISSISGLTNITSGQTPEIERTREQAKNALGRLKSFEGWLKTAGEEALKSARNLWGTEKRCYDAIRDGLAELAEAS